MIYLENNTNIQVAYIPKDDEAIGGGSHGGSYQQGFQDGYASGYTDGVESTEGYEQGYTDGFNDGHSSGVTDGYSSGYTERGELLSSTAITSNGEYTNANGWSSVTVNVPQGQGYDEGYAAGYAAGHQAGQQYGYEIGYADGVVDGRYQITSTFTSLSVDRNGNYGSVEHPLTAVTVQVPQTGHTDQEMQERYNLGYSDGVAHQKSLLSTTAITSNGEYSSENGWEEITVNVPQNNPNIEEEKTFTATTNGTSSITPSPIWEILFTSKESVYDNYYHFTIDGTISSGYYGQAAYRLDYHNFEDYGYVLVKIDQNGGLELDTSNYDQEDEPVWLRFDQSKGRYDFGGNRISASNFTEHPLSNIEYYYAMSSVTLTVNVPQVHPSFGELYCLACDNARFEIASGNGLTSQLTLTQASAQFLGSYRGELGYNGETMSSWGASAFNSGDTKYGRYYYNWGHPLQPPVTGSIDIIDTMEFPEFHTTSIMRVNSKVSLSKDGWQIISPQSAPSVSGTSVSIFVQGYLKGANFNNSYCSLFPAVDDDGNACLVWNGTYIYPVSGECHPVYKKTVEGVDKYMIVTELT